MCKAASNRNIGILTQVLLGLWDELVDRGHVVSGVWSKGRGKGSVNEVLYKLLVEVEGFEIYFVGYNGVDKLTVAKLYGRNGSSSRDTIVQRDWDKKSARPSLLAHVVLSVELDDPKCFDRVFDVIGEE